MNMLGFLLLLGASGYQGTSAGDTTGQQSALGVINHTGDPTSDFQGISGVTPPTGDPKYGDHASPEVFTTEGEVLWDVDPAEEAENITETSPRGPMEESEDPIEEAAEEGEGPMEDPKDVGNWTLEEAEATPGTGHPEPKTPSPALVPGNETLQPTRSPREQEFPRDRSLVQARSTSVTTLPYCTCDLTPGTCDINCCCDSSCGLTDPLAVFSYCLPGSTSAVSQTCVGSTLIFRNNTSANTTTTADQFCVQTNGSSLNFFVTPRNVTSDDFPGLVADYGGPSFIQPDEPVPETPAFYKVGDAIWTLGNSSTLGILQQPVAMGPGRACADKNPAGFLTSQNSSCVRTFTNLNLSCTSDPALSADSYYRFFSVLKVPSVVNSSVPQQVAISPTSTPASPSLNDSYCINVVSQVSYVIDYNGSQGIQGVSVSFTLTNLSGDAGSFLQSFSIFFRSVSVPLTVSLYQSSSQITQDTVPRSGNPGYIVGAPLLTNVGGTRKPVTLMQGGSDGTCSAQVQPKALFRTNMRTGCKFSEPASNSCTGFVDQLSQALLGTSPPQQLAQFGNTDPSQSTGWVLVNSINCTNQTLGNCSTGCIVPVSVEILVLWAEVGLRSNPQAQLLGAHYQYHCKLLKCQSPVILETVLTFVDTTLYPDPPRGKPAADWKLPFDFFFPFRVALSGGSVLGRGVSDTILFTLAALTFHRVLKL